MSDHYRQREIMRVVDNGPADGDERYRVRIIGNESTRTLMVSREELVSIAALFDANDNGGT